MTDAEFIDEWWEEQRAEVNRCVYDHLFVAELEKEIPLDQAVANAEAELLWRINPDLAASLR